MSILKSLGVDPKMYKHVKSNAKSTTLQHKHGHLITLAHNVLSPKMQSQLKALSKIGAENQTSSQAQEAQDQNPKMADGGRVEKALSPVKKFVDKNTDSKQYKQAIEEKPKGGNVIPYDEVSNYAEGGESKQMNDMQIIPDKGYGKIIIMKADGGQVTDPGILDKVGKYLHSLNSDSIQAQTQELDKNKHGGSPDNANPNRTGDYNPSQYASGGKIKAYADPQEVVSKDDSAPVIDAKPEEHDSAKDLRSKLESAGDFIRNHIIGNPIGPQGTPMDRDALDQPQQDRQPAQQMSQAPQPQQAPQASMAPQADPAAQQAPQPQPQGMDQAMIQNQGLMEQGYQNQLAGFQQEAQAKANLGEQQAGQIQGNLDAQTGAKAAFENAFNNLNQEREGIMHDINDGHIDPEKYWKGDKNGEGGHSKIMTGLGMILAGFNPTSNPNAAINFLKFQMEQNLKSQEKNLDSQQNLLHNNLQQFGNLKDATEMTRLQQSDILHNQMLKAASMAATPMAKAEMLQKAGQLQQAYAPQRQQFAMRMAMMNLAQGGTNGNDPSDTRAYEHALNYMRMLNPEQAKEWESRLIPGVGVSKVPIPQGTRDSLIAHQKLEKAATELKGFIQAHGGFLDRMTPQNRAIVAQMVLPVQSAFREGTLGTVYREGEQPLLDKAIKGQPLDMAQYFLNTEPKKLDQMMKTNKQQADILKQSVGLPTQAAPQEKQYKTVNGVKYERGPNGEAVPVK